MCRAAFVFLCLVLACGETVFAEEPLQMFGEPKGIERRFELVGHKGEIADSIYLADGKLLTAGADGTIRLWDLTKAKQVEVVAELEEPITKLELIADRQQFLSYSTSGKITAWQLPQPKRGWGPEQASGSPDSASGDQSTAWASATEDNQFEWLVLEYADSLTPVEIQIYENFNAGAIEKITAFDTEATEQTLWELPEEGEQPKSQFGILTLPLEMNGKLKRIKLYINSAKVAGWNEIDAVGLVDHKGKLHWATAAAASSTYADRQGRGELQFTR